MSIKRIIKKEMEKSNGEVRIVEVPKEKRPTAKDLIKLEKEIKSHVAANEAMMVRSWKNSNK